MVPLVIAIMHTKFIREPIYQKVHAHRALLVSTEHVAATKASAVMLLPNAALAIAFRAAMLLRHAVSTQNQQRGIALSTYAVRSSVSVDLPVNSARRVENAHANRDLEPVVTPHDRVAQVAILHRRE